VMGDEILEDLNGGDPGLSFVCYARLSANAHNHLIMMHTIDQISEGVGKNFGVGVDLCY